MEVSRGVLDALTAGIVVLDDAGGVRFVNAAFRGFAEVLPADHPFREACTTGCDFLGLTRRALTRPGFGTLVADGLAAVLAGRETVFRYAFACDQAMASVFFAMEATPSAEGGLVLAYQDVSRQHQLECALRASEEGYRTVVEDQTEVISRFAGDGSFLFVNEVYCRFFGKSEDELLGRHWHPVAHPDDLPLINVQLARLSPDNPVVTIENRVWSASGEMRWMQFVNRATFDAAGRVTEIQSVGRDITSLKAVGEALDQSRASLRALLAETEQVREEERKAIAAEIHDELGAALTAAVFGLNALAPHVSEEGVLALAGLRSTLAGASLTAREISTRLRPPMLDDLGLVETCRWYAGEWSRTTGIRVTTRLARLGREPEESLRVDLFRILQELLTNVARHAGATRVAIVLSAGREALTLSVSDDGAGFTRPREGGLGLAGIRERARRHGGLVTVDPGPPGARVRARIPLVFGSGEVQR